MTITQLVLEITAVAGACAFAALAIGQYKRHGILFPLRLLTLGAWGVMLAYVAAIRWRIRITAAARTLWQDLRHEYLDQLVELSEIRDEYYATVCRAIHSLPNPKDVESSESLAEWIDKQKQPERN